LSIAVTLAAIQREGTPEDYESAVKDFYGYLREACERAVEEVLLNGVVTRLAVEVHTNQLEKVLDIVQEDWRVVDDIMTKSSSKLRGHDEPMAVDSGVPLPMEINSDLTKLDDWVKAVRKRRNKKR
jgi:hypothetical protein